ncbi:MAG: glycosyltransferase family 39 protein [Candidatus Daviesbacteria bacterium]|nr:glycosyltransferase family 39 protein [Candidatus Daviesbacteria bacterium]
MFSSWNKYVLLFFLTYLSIGLFIYKDYGISWDEPSQRQVGYVNYVYLTGKDKEVLSNFADKYYGPVFELPLIIMERVLRVEDPKTIYQMRHLITFGIFYLGVIFFYFLNTLIFNDKKYGLIACVLLVLSPRIFADSFYNSKDIPFLSFFIISTFTLFKLIEKRSWKWVFLHAFATTLLVGIRAIGIIMPLITLLVLLKENFIHHKTFLKKIVVYLFVTMLMIVLSWPLLWMNPLNILSVLKNMVNFNYQTNLPILYMGKYISPFSVPWHYIPVWIFITVPVTYGVLFVIGLIRTIFEKNVLNLVLLLLIISPVIGVIILHSTLYDGWRHLYFVYPFMVIFMVRGLKSVPRPLVILTCIEIVTVIIFMWRYHPYQNLYFNIALNQNMKEVKQNYELDYWGLSYRQALEFIVKNDSAEKIPVLVANNPGNSNSLMLDQVDRQRLQYLPDGDLTNAKYFVSNYRWHIDDYSYGQEVYNFQIGGAKIISVYKLK